MSATTPLTKSRAALRAAWMSLGAILAASVLVAIIIALIQMRKDADTEDVVRDLEPKIKALGPRVKDVYMNVFGWINHRPGSASRLDKLWNRKYPAVVGKVKAQEDLDELKEVVRVVCEKNHFDPELVAFVVQVEGVAVRPFDVK